LELKRAHPNDSDNVLIKMRIHFLKGFISHKIMNPLPPCPIECFFWEQIYSYFPNNPLSPLRFKSFSREFLQFLLENKRFSEDYVTWIQKNSEKIIEQFDGIKDSKIISYDVKLYSDILMNIIREIFHCVIMVLIA